MNKIFHITYLLLLTSLMSIGQITNNPPPSSYKDSYTSGSITRCGYNLNFSETHLSGTVNHLAKAGQSIRIQASSGISPNSNIGGFSSGSFHAFVDPSYNLSGCGASGTIVWDNLYAGDGSVERMMRPVDYQLYPRNSSNKGTVVFSGTDNGNNSTITFYTAKTNFNNVTSLYNMTTVNIVNKRFYFTLPIDAELSEYSFAYFLNGNAFSAVTIAQHVVCGDAYLISGQSNASTGDLSVTEIDYLVNTFGANTTYGKYSRTIDMYSGTTWGVSRTNDDFAWSVGAWGLPIQYKIQQTYGIPTCIINGAQGSTSIEYHVPLPSFPNDFFFNPINDPLYPDFENTNSHPGSFGRMNTRVYFSGLEKDIKGIFWWQGDAGGDVNYNYIDHFTPLYNLWTTYYPNFGRFYMVQIPSYRDGYEAIPGSGIRVRSEYQRKFGTAFPNTTVMAANGIKYHRTESGHEIHHQAAGYVDLANRLFALLEKDVYGKTTNINDLTPPDIVSATISGNTVSLRFNQNIYVNSSLGDNLNDILSVIKFNNELTLNPATVIKSNALVSGQYLTFDINSATGINRVSYAGFIPNTTASQIDNVGCYIRNSKNIGALSFHNFPVTPPGPAMREVSNMEAPEQEFMRKTLQINIYPNPSNDHLIVNGNDQIIKKVRICDPTGKMVYESQNQCEILTCDIKNLASGLYFVTVETLDQRQTTQLIKLENQ